MKILPLALGLVLVLAACGESQQRLNERPTWIHRRDTVPFGEALPAPSAATIAQSDRVDALEKLFTDGRDGECRKQLARFFAEGGDHPRAHDLNGRLLILEGKYAEAADAFGRAVAGSPRWLQPRLAQAECFLELKRPQAAASVYAELDRLMPDAPWGPWGMGLIAAQGKDSDRSIALLDEALRRDPEHVPSLLARAGMAERAGDTVKEEALLLHASALDPDNAQTWLRLAALTEADNRLVDAETHLARAFALTGDPRLRERLAQLCDRRGDPAAAARWRTTNHP